MRALIVVLVLMSCALWGSLGVEVRAGEKSFPLEAVKLLKELMDSDVHVHANPSLVETKVAAVCANPGLPGVFHPVCQEKGAAVIFSQLVDVIKFVDPCEICANPSCFGCLE